MFLYSAFSNLFVPSIFTCQKDYVLSHGNMPVMMGFILEYFLVKFLSIFVIPLTLFFGWFWFLLLVFQCIIKKDGVGGKEISCAPNKTFSTQFPPMSNLKATFKTAPLNTFLPFIIIGVVQVFRWLFGKACVSYYPSVRMHHTNDLCMVISSKVLYVSVMSKFMVYLETFACCSARKCVSFVNI